jgi:hypothetical protein
MSKLDTTTGASMAHDEFPPLQLSGKSILCAALASRINMIGGVRPFVAAVIRETARQAQEAGCANNLVSVSDLLLIADNLHSPPPPPPSPTRQEMDAALNHLLPYLFFAKGSRVDGWVETLQRGIAHHCKVQP